MADQILDYQYPDKLNLGVAELDDQHRAFFQHMVDLRKALTEGVGARDRLMRTLRYLDTFISEHFQAEERYMRLHNYPGILLHRAEHEVFAQAVADLKKKALDLERRGEATSFLAVEVEHRLERWLEGHIGTMDRKMADYLRDRM